ncbi:MAG: YdcF family protein [Tabrizicola sp.]|nr:YdcF family protein [Tabrizicola sp.]
MIKETERKGVTGNKRILVLLGARMARTRGPDCWRFPLFLEEPTDSATCLPGEVSGGSSRMRAVQAEHDRSREGDAAHGLLVLVTGGNERDGSSRADEATRQLVSRYGLPGDAVVSIRGAGSTLGNAAATVEYIRSHRHIVGDVKTIAIVTNDYHMLRAWIIFSRGMLVATTGTELVVSAGEQERIRRILLNGLPVDRRWSQGRVKKDRARVMKILRPHFSTSGIKITPLVVEETLERSSRHREVARRYASRLRNSIWVRKTLRFEYERIIDMLCPDPVRFCPRGQRAI